MGGGDRLGGADGARVGLDGLGAHLVEAGALAVAPAAALVALDPHALEGGVVGRQVPRRAAEAQRGPPPLLPGPLRLLLRLRLLRLPLVRPTQLTRDLRGLGLGLGLGLP